MPTTRKLSVENFRSEFPMLRGSRAPAYLDSAASTQTPNVVLKAMDGYYRHYRANVHRGLYDASERATATYEAARGLVAELLNATPEEIIFTRGATESLNLAAYLLSEKLGPGDEVVTTVMEHHSNLVPWQQLAKRRGFTLKFIGITPEYALDMNQARQLIGPKTKVLAVTHVSNALGTVVPVAELAKLARAVGATVVVDAAQSVGHRPVDVKALDCDFLAFSGHKMFGPTGIGVLYGRRALLEKLPPFFFGGDMISEVSLEDATWNDLPWKFEAGTPNVAGAIGLGEAVAFVRRLDAGRVHEQERIITDYAIGELTRVPGLRLIGPAAGTDRAPVISFVIDGLHPHDAATILGKQGVCVRGGHHCAMPLMRLLGLTGTTRASLCAYTTKDDVKRLASALRQALRLFKLKHK